jgi:hypothetical protein
MFLAPDGSPFWGGTYFPPESRYGRPGFPHVLREIARIWREERHKVLNNTAAIRNALTRLPGEPPATINTDILTEASLLLARNVDPVHGGLRGAPKFPQSPVFAFLWEVYLRARLPELRNAVLVTLRNMAEGGIYDHLGGGLCRYSVDGHWLVPHFEKMLYDNAQFISLLTRAWAQTRDALFEVRIDETAAFMLDQMTTADGAFASSYDADSEGEEGKYYVWTKTEIDRLLGGDAPLFNEIYGVTAGGNWEGHNILNRLTTAPSPDDRNQPLLARCRATLLAARLNRSPPALDDKVLTDWNGLAITALAEAALVLNRPHYLAAAAHAFDRILSLLAPHGKLHHAYRAGQLRGEATADDYANLISAALALYAATANAEYLHHAAALTDSLFASHWDTTRPGFYLASAATTDLFIRPRYGHDDATPNANATMIYNLAALAHLTGTSAHRSRAESILETHAAAALANPFAYPGILRSAIALLDPVQAISAAPQPSPEHLHLLQIFAASYGPSAVMGHVAAAQDLPPGHPAHAKAATAGPRLYICRGNTCAAPASSAADITQAIDLLGLARS